MATKVLITPKNSVWGVIVNPQSSNTYRHALSFDTPELKKAFIDQELCEGKDYKSLLAAQPEISLTRISATTAVFTVTPDQYQDETFLTLLNKDFCIIEEDGIEQFYTLSGVRDPDLANTINFTAELDIFFTYDIKNNMFNNQKTEIARSMIDRFKFQNNQILPLDSYLASAITSKESFESGLSEVLIPASNREIISITSNLVPTGTDTSGNGIDCNFEYIPSSPPDPDLENDIKDYINNTQWEMITVITKQNTDIPLTHLPKRFGTPLANFDDRNFTSFSGKGDNGIFAINTPTKTSKIALPYVNFITPIELPFQTKDQLSKNISWGILNDPQPLSSGFSKFKRYQLENPNVLKNSYQILPFSPLNYLDIDIIVKIYPDVISIDLRFDTPLEEPTQEYNCRPFQMENAQSSTSPVYDYAIGIYEIEKSLKEISTNITPLIIPSVLDPFSPKSVVNEPKLQTSPFTIFEIGSSTKNKSIIKPELFNTNEKIKLRINNSYLTTLWGYIIELKNYGTHYIPSNPFLNSSLKFTIEDFGAYLMPTDKDSWEEYIVRNKSSQSSSFLQKGLGIGVGILGAAAAPISGGLAGIGLASLAAKSASDINSQFSMRKDIKNTPNTFSDNGSTFPFDHVNKTTKPYIQKFELDPFSKSLVFDHIYKYGYVSPASLADINLALSSRYWFNYIEVPQSLENIILQVSSGIKQLINDTLSDGLTIWHIRDLNTFKGIKNYDYENVEMSLLTIQNNEVIGDNRKEK